MKVLDTSAIVAFLFGESGGEAAFAAFPGGLLSTVNAAEVMIRFARDGVDVDQTLGRLKRLGLSIIEPDLENAAIAASLSRHRGLSLGDCFCIALARQRGAPVVTADRAWADLDLGVTVELIR